jgi:hypothetical protein
MSAVHEHRQSDGARAAVVDERVHRGSDRPAGEEDIVNEHDDAAIDGERDLGFADHRRVPDARQVVAVERDVDRAKWDIDALVRLDRRLDAGRERVATRADPDDGEKGEVAITLDDLMRDPRDRSSDVVA